MDGLVPFREQIQYSEIYGERDGRFDFEKISGRRSCRPTGSRRLQHPRSPSGGADSVGTSHHPGARAHSLFGVAGDRQLCCRGPERLGQGKGLAGQPGQERPQLPTAYFLAISGGGDNGAFGSGFLNGWTASGTRPEFKVVTGVSTGALIAPFAFMGPKYDYVVRKVYTTTAQKNIFKKRRITARCSGGFDGGHTAVGDTHSILRHARVPRPRLRLNMRKGRILLVGTANLDSMEPVIWNMTAIAASQDPRAPLLFRQHIARLCLYSRRLPTSHDQRHSRRKAYQEMHVDGGTVAQVFLYPPSISTANSVKRKRVLYIIRNARLDADWASTERRTMSIAMRAIDSLTTTQGIGDLYRIYATAERDGLDLTWLISRRPSTRPTGRCSTPHTCSRFTMSDSRRLRLVIRGRNIHPDSLRRSVQNPLLETEPDGDNSGGPFIRVSPDGGPMSFGANPEEVEILELE